MVNSRFFSCGESFSLEELAQKTNTKLVNATDLRVKNVAGLDTAESGDITFLDNPKYASQLADTKASVCVLKEKFVAKAPKGLPLLISADPYRTFAEIIALFYADDTPPKMPSEIDSTATIEQGAIVCDGAKIGKNTVIQAGAIIRENVIIGDDCVIHSGVAISHCIIGDRAIIHHNACLGQDGFGFAMSATHLKVKQLGTVIIGNDVEIGAGTCVDRGSMSDTIIGDGTKIDNLVQVGHNAKIGNHCVIVAQVAIAGSSEIGNYVVMGGQSAIAGHLKVGDGAMFVARSGIVNNLEGGQAYGGAPAVPVKEWRRAIVAIKRLGKGKRK